MLKRQQRPFVDRVKIGEYGEDATIHFFNSKKYLFKDVRKVPEYQKKEIDFVVNIKNKNYTVEVKSSEINMHKYNSIMVKLETQYEDTLESNLRGDDAYLFRTEASHLFYVCCMTGDILIVNTKKLRDYVNANQHNLLIKTYKDCEEDPTKSRYDRINTVAYIPIPNISSFSKRIKSNYKKLNLNEYNISTKRQ